MPPDSHFRRMQIGKIKNASVARELPCNPKVENDVRYLDYDDVIMVSQGNLDSYLFLLLLPLLCSDLSLKPSY